MRSTAQGGETISGADRVSRARLLYELKASRENRPPSPTHVLSTLPQRHGLSSSFLGAAKGDVTTPLHERSAALRLRLFLGGSPHLGLGHGFLPSLAL